MTTPTEPIAVERCRPFSLADAMIFVAASAVGLWLADGSIRALWDVLSESGFASLYSPRLASILAFDMLNVGVVMLLVLATAFLAVRLRGPRPPFGRVVLQPGMIACEVQILSFGLAVSVGYVRPMISHWFLSAVLIASVPLAWGILAWTSRWRREPGWIDRLGLVLGAGWCLDILIFNVLAMIAPL